MKRMIFLIFIALFSISCDSGPNYTVRFKENSCIKEINRSYASVAESPTSIYKLEQITTESELKVSTWHNHSWYYTGRKKYTYFRDTNLFKYKTTKCPDGSDGKASIVDRLKTIDL